jgi:hypothetical protein
MSHWLWEHFFTDGTLYRSNHSNKNAWCIQCLAYHYKLIQNNNIIVTAMTGMTQGRTHAEIDMQGMFQGLLKVWKLTPNFVQHA